MELGNFIAHMCAAHSLIRVTVENVTLSGLPANVYELIPGEYLRKKVSEIEVEASTIIIHLEEQEEKC